MTAALPFIDINNHRFAAIPNPKAEWSYYDQAVEAYKGTNLAFRLFQLIERLAKAVSMTFKEYGSHLSVFFGDLADKVGIAWQALVIPRLPDVTKKAWQAITHWGEAPEGPAGHADRANLQRIHDIADGGASLGYFWSFITGNVVAKNTADVINLGADATDLAMAAEDYKVAKKHFEHIDAENVTQATLRQRFMETMREALFRIAKAVASVASGVIGLMVLAFGGPLVPASFLLALSLISTISAMSAHFYKETRDFTKVEFFKNSDLRVDHVVTY